MNAENAREIGADGSAMGDHGDGLASVSVGQCVDDGDDAFAKRSIVRHRSHVARLLTNGVNLEAPPAMHYHARMRRPCRDPRPLWRFGGCPAIIRCSSTSGEETMPTKGNT